MNLSDELNKVIKQYAVGNKLSAYKKFKKIYLQNNKNINMRFNLAVMQQELGFLDEAEVIYHSYHHAHELQDDQKISPHF